MRLAAIEAPVAAQVLADLTSRVLAMRDDFVHSPIAYYFHPRDARHALPVLLPALIDVVEDAPRPSGRRRFVSRPRCCARRSTTC